MKTSRFPIGNVRDVRLRQRGDGICESYLLTQHALDSHSQASGFRRDESVWN